MKLPNIVYNGDISKFIYAGDDESLSISMYKDNEYFFDIVNTNKFIKGIERVTRTSPDYNVFVRWVKTKLGMNFCQVFGDVTDEDVTIELHHGPLFTLYDICEVVLNSFISTGRKISTLRVADKVLDEHFDLNVQFIMLCVTSHEAVHNKDLFINIGQGIGDIDTFIKKYTPFLSDEHKYKIWNYVNLCENNTAFLKSFDRGLLDLDYVKKYIPL